jgi:hypothetical protein
MTQDRTTWPLTPLGTAILSIVVFLVVLLFLAFSAHAEEQVTADLVCRVQSAIRHRSPAWAPAECTRVAAALNRTPEPRVSMAIAINESDLRPRVMVRVAENVYDGGLMGVRCVLDGGRCTNGPARGLTLTQLKDPSTNIRVAAAIMASKRAIHGADYLRAYNGGTREHGYGARIGAIAAALGGTVVRVDSRRVRELARRIVLSLGFDGRTS